MSEGSGEGPEVTQPNQQDIAEPSLLQQAEVEITPEVVTKKLLDATQDVRRSLGPLIPDEDIDKASEQARDAIKLMRSSQFPNAQPDIEETYDDLNTNLALDPWSKPKPGQEKKDLERIEPPETDDPEKLEVHEKPDYIRPHVENFFPELTRMYRGEYDTYDSAFDGFRDRSRILYFYAGEERNNDTPIIAFNFRPGGILINIFNASNLENNPNPGPSIYTVYGPREDKFQLDQLDLVLAKAKIIMYGVDIDSPEIRNQFFRWSKDLKGFITVQEAIDDFKMFLDEAETPEDRKDRFLSEIQVDASEHNFDLVIERISGKETYNFRGDDIPIDEAIDHVRKKSKIGKDIIALEIGTIEAYRSLLIDRGLLPVLSTIEGDPDQDYINVHPDDENVPNT